MLAALLILSFAASLHRAPSEATVRLMPLSLSSGGVSVSEVYGRPRLTGAGVRVAVVDTGVDYTHPDLRDRVRVLASFTTTTLSGQPLVFIVGVNGSLDDALALDSFVLERTGRYAWLDENGHGTHVAGLIAGSGALSGGRYMGVAPGVELWSVKVLGRNGTGSVDALYRALSWLAEEDVDIVCMALGLSSPEAAEKLKPAVDRLAASGKLIVAAAGNSGLLGAVDFPARFDGVYAIAAVDRNGEKAPFSSMGTPLDWKPDFAAVGVSLVSTVPLRGNALGVSPPYAALSGTSMATGVAAGILALWVEAVGRDAVRRRDFLAAHASIPASPLVYKTLSIGYGLLVPPQH